MTQASNLKIALCHDYLIKNGGAERVLQELHKIFPNAPVFTLLYDEEKTKGMYKDWDVRTSWLQKSPGVKRMVNYYRAFMPQAVESFDLTEFDVVISDSSSFIKGVITQPHTLHISYIHTPARFLWFDIGSHIKRGKFGALAKLGIPAVLHRIRQWDYISAQRPDILIANSENTRKRIEKFYRLSSQLVHPPVDVDRFRDAKRMPEDFYLIVSRLEPHKDIDIAINACNALHQSLVIIGSGSHLGYLKSIAGPTIAFKGELTDSEVAGYYLKARAFLAPQDEDFGITLVEALASGCPVIARKSGGALEIVEQGKTGILINDIDAISLSDVLKKFDPDQISSDDCRMRANDFSSANFASRITCIIQDNIKRKDRSGIK